MPTYPTRNPRAAANPLRSIRLFRPASILRPLAPLPTSSAAGPCPEHHRPVVTAAPLLPASSDAELAAIVMRLSAAIDLEDDGPPFPPLDPIHDEITDLVLSACPLRPTTAKGFAAKGWIVLGYSDLTDVGDRVFRSLMYDLAERGRA